MRRLRQETLTEKIYRYRGVIFVVCVPIALITFVLLLMPRTLDDASIEVDDPFNHVSQNNKASGNRYSVIFDAGSSGSRIHVFCFDKNLELVRMGNELELFKQIKPGLSSYADTPQQGAQSLKGLLDEALGLVPGELVASTPVRLGATAGLRSLPGDSAENLLEQVRVFMGSSGFKFKSSWATILDGSQEGTYQWITVNYLLGNLRKPFDQTVGVVDLGGGSVQMSYAVSAETAKKAPKPLDGREAYVKSLKLLGHTYHLYVYSYLRYGLNAARMEILKLVEKGSDCPCLLKGFHGTYKYGSDEIEAKSIETVGDFESCKELALNALRIKDTCQHTELKCTFGGIWNGGGGDGQKKLLVASFFFDKALEAGILKGPSVIEFKIKPSDFEDRSKTVCQTPYLDMNEHFTLVDEEVRPYLCMDLVYQYTLLVHGFGIDPHKEVTLVKKVKYHGLDVEAAWALGMAIESMS